MDKQCKKLKDKDKDKDKKAVIYCSGLRTTNTSVLRSNSFRDKICLASFAIFLWPYVRGELRKGSFLFQTSIQMSANNGQKTERRESCAVWVCCATEWNGTKYQHNNYQQN